MHNVRRYMGAQQGMVQAQSQKARILADSGTIGDWWLMNKIARLNKANNSNLVLSVCSFGGNKLRASGVNNFTTKSYDLRPSSPIDLTQSTAGNQLPLVKIIPSEMPYFYNSNGGSNYLYHSLITFAPTDSWTIELVLNWNGDTIDDGGNILGDPTYQSYIQLRRSGANRLRIRYPGPPDYTFTTDLSPYIGKTTAIHVTFSPGSAKLYINGLYKETKASAGTDYFKISALCQRIGYAPLYGRIYVESIWNTIISDDEIARRSREILPAIEEIKSVSIGTQTWPVKNFDVVTTCLNNSIQEVQSSTNTEKMTNGGISGTTDWVDSNSDGLADYLKPEYGSNGVPSIVTGNGFTGNAQRITISANAYNWWAWLETTFAPTIGKWYKISLKYRSSKGIVFNYIKNGGVGVSVPVNTGNAVSATLYGQCTGTARFLFSSLNNVVAGDYNEIDELSIQEIGWSGSQELYDGVYAQTSGDASAKTYAALKASAMWCHLNNDPLNGVLHGKLYNGFALKLIDSDITTFNTNNPASSFGYGLPSDDEITTLVSTIGGSTVAGGHLKFPGTTYWTSPNTGADNSSGFSALQSGYRNADGSFVIGTRFIMWTTTSGITGRNRRLLLDYNSAASNQNINGDLLTLGFSIRMIKR